MQKKGLLEIINKGENAGVEFKRDDLRPEQLAREIVAFANHQGGYFDSWGGRRWHYFRHPQSWTSGMDYGLRVWSIYPSQI